MPYATALRLATASLEMSPSDTPQGADGSALRVIHMLDECIKYIAHVAPDAEKIGLMSTTGTRESRVYRDLLEPRGYEVLEVDPEQQSDVHETIYNQVRCSPMHITIIYRYCARFVFAAS